MANLVVGVSEMVGTAQAGGGMRPSGMKHSIIGAVGMASASGKESFKLGAELHRLRCAGQATRWHVTVGMIHRQLLGLARKRRWRRGQALNGQIERMADQLLRDWLFDLCLSCVGRGHVQVDVPGADERKDVECDACRGNGRSALKSRNMGQRMDVLGISDDEYIRVWAERFEEGMGILEKSYSVAQRSIARRLARAVEDA